MLFDITVSSSGGGQSDFVSEFVGEVRTMDIAYAVAMVTAALQLFRDAPAEQRVTLVHDALHRRAAAEKITDALLDAKEKKLERN